MWKLIIISSLKYLTTCDPCFTRACVPILHLLRFPPPFRVMSGIQSFERCTWYSSTTLGCCATQRTVPPETSKRCKRTSYFPLGAHFVVPSTSVASSRGTTYIRRLACYYCCGLIIATRTLVTNTYLVFFKVASLPADNTYCCQGVYYYIGICTPIQGRLNIVGYRYHLTGKMVRESMRVVLIVRTAPLVCIDTCRLYLVLKTICGQQHAAMY